MSHAKTGMRRLTEIVLAVVALTALFIWSEGLLHTKVEPGIGVREDSAWSGSTFTAATMAMPEMIEAPGRIEAFEEAVISPRVMGVLERVHVREGDRVKKGMVLATVAAPELSQQSSSAEAGVVAAEAAQAQARRDLERMERLYQSQVVARVEWERAKTGFEQAEANLAAARGHAGSASAVASYSTLRAPFDGLVIERTLDPGALVSPGAPIVKLVDDRSYMIEISIDEARAASLRIGDSVVAVIDALGAETAARISRITPASDPRSHTVTVKADLPLMPGITSGQYGRLKLTCGMRHGIAVPSGTVYEVSGSSYVKVLGPEKRPAVRFVRTGRQLSDGMVEILSGLAEGDEVCIER